jgi:uncharacterized protein (DUF3084 family)
LLKKDIDASSSLKEQLGSLKIENTTLEGKCTAKDVEISSMHEKNKKLSEERDSVAEESRQRDACKTVENETLRADLTRVGSDLAQAHKDSENQRQQLVAEQEMLLQAAERLGVAEEGLATLEREKANLSEVVSTSFLYI